MSAPEHEENRMSITPEEFMAQHEPDEPDEELDPLASIAQSLRQLADVVVRRDTQETAEDETQQALNQLDREYAELEALHDAKQALLDKVLEICKPSTSKLANTIRDAITPLPAIAEPNTSEAASDEPAEPDCPDDDADVEEWRAYARSRGYAGPDLDKANRSQIRSMLDIAHPSIEETGANAAS